MPTPHAERKCLRLCAGVLVLLALPAAAGAVCQRDTESDLSPLAAAVLTNIQTIPLPGILDNSPADPAKIFSACNRFASLEIDGPDIFAAARDLIAQADHEVDLAFFDWQSDTEGSRLIGDGLISAQVGRSASDRLLVRFLIYDPPSQDAFLQLFQSYSDWIGRGLDPSRFDFQWATSPASYAWPAYHDKYIVVDARHLLITGANVQDKNDPALHWHDSAYVLEGDVGLAALSAFEDAWSFEETKHWICDPVCEPDGTHPAPDHSWLPVFGAQAPGDVPVLMVGRNGSDALSNDTDNPQDVAWLTLLALAQSHVYIQTPNINDDDFRAGVIAAVGRGVNVRLITGLGFNDGYEEFVGGSNLETVGNLRKAIRSNYPAHQHLFEVRWYGEDGREPITDNGPGSSHVKYMTVDGQVAMVGSGNQDTASWNISHELNVLIDDPGVTSLLDNTLFLPDWQRSMASYLELYEALNGTQDIVCVIPAKVNQGISFEDQPWPLQFDTWRCNNDEAKSILLHEVEAGRVFRFFDNPDPDHKGDDWIEITTKRHLVRKYLPTLEIEVDDADVRVVHHRDDGLNGKVSAAEVSGSSVGPVVDLYSEHNGAGQLACSIRGASVTTVNLQNDDECSNDSAKSLRLYDFPADKVVVLHDSPSGSTGDDWTVVVPKRALSGVTVGNLEQSLENADVRVCHFHVNGLNGKVSRARIGSLAELAGICGVTHPSHGRPYTVSPAPHGNYPDSGGELTDGSIGTGISWVNAAGWLYTDPTITLDLGQVQSLGNVSMYVGNSHGNGSFGVARPANVAVSVSSDGVTWTGAGNLSFSGWSDLGTKEQVDRGIRNVATSARWVRFTVTRGGAWTMVTELIVAGSTGPPPSGPSYAVTPAPSGSYPDSGGELTDGGTATGTDWIQAVGWLYVDPVLTLDLGQVQPVAEVQLFVGNSHGNGSFGVARPASVAVAVSSDGSTWTNVGNLSFNVWSNAGLKFQVDRGSRLVSTSGRFVRFTVTRGGAWTMMTEARVFDQE